MPEAPNFDWEPVDGQDGTIDIDFAKRSGQKALMDAFRNLGV